jgi:hypothetical protein
MDLAKHFDAYRKSVLRDALDEGSWYAKQIRTRDGQPVYDWLSAKVEEIKAAIREGRLVAYRRLVDQHQTAMIHLYEAMVADHLWDYKQVGPQQLLDLIDEQGTNWFKFCKTYLKMSVEGTPMLWVPRYIYPWMAMAQEGTVVFDADELHVLRQYPAQAKRMFLEKQAEPSMKIFASTPNASYLKQKPFLCNTAGAVNDWTAPLFDVETMK